MNLVLFTLLLRPLVSPDVLPLSLQNEVDHALASVTNRPPVTNALHRAAQAEFAALFATNAPAERARRLVSTQKDGEWFYRGTNVTEAAVRLLLDLQADTPASGEASETAN